MADNVTLGTFARLETARMFRDLQAVAGGPNRWHHNRAATAIDAQTVVRMNRDTLYSLAVVDLAEPVELVVPQSGGRYLSVMAVTEDHYINKVFHDAGVHPLDPAVLGSRYVLLAARVLADPDDPADLEKAHEVQDGLALLHRASEPFVMPDVDAASLDGLRAALAALAPYGFDSRRAFGSEHHVDPLQHLIGTAVGWGGLPETEAVYDLAAMGLPDGHYTIRVTDVPVDGFWSLSVYDADGFFAPNDLGRYSVNSVTAQRDADGGVTINLGGDPALPNQIPLPAGWNATVRLYRPHREVVDGTWTFPAPAPA